MIKSKYLLSILLLGFIAPAGAQTQTEPKADKQEILTVLVRTDGDRNVVDVRPELELTPTAQRVLRSNLVHHLKVAGESVADYRPNSLFFADLSPVVTEADGQNFLHFELVSTRPSHQVATRPSSQATKAWPARWNLSGNGIGPLVELPAPIPPTRSN